VVARTVNIDYHIAFDTNYYSVPYNLVQELVEVRSTPTTIELFHKGQRVASHLRARGHGHTVTISEHRPRSHREHLEWTPSRMVHWAESIGPHTARLFERILADKPHPEMGYRGCLGIIRLAAGAPLLVIPNPDAGRGHAYFLRKDVAARIQLPTRRMLRKEADRRTEAARKKRWIEYRLDREAAIGKPLRRVRATVSRDARLFLRAFDAASVTR